MKCLIKTIFKLKIFIFFITIIAINSGKNNKFNSKLKNTNYHRIRMNQPPYITVTVDPHQVEAEDVGFRTINVPVMRSGTPHPGTLAAGMSLPSYAVQSPIDIPIHPTTNIHQRNYLPNSDPFGPLHLTHNPIPVVPNPVPVNTQIVQPASHFIHPATNPGMSAMMGHLQAPLPSLHDSPLHDTIVHTDTNQAVISTIHELDGDEIPINIIPVKGNKKRTASLHPKKKILDLHQEHPVNNFFQWALNIGIRMKKLLVFEDKNTGKSSIKTGEEINSNEKILEVPNDQLIYPNSKYLSKLCDDVKNMNVSSQNLKEYKSNSDQICMAIYILTKDAKSNPFINFLFTNTNFQSFPFFFNQEESDMIKGSFFQNLVDVKRHSINTEYKLLLSAKLIPEGVTKKDYLKARVIIMGNSLKISDTFNGQETVALIPVASLFEHGPKKNGYLKINKENEVEVIAERKINSNENIILNVGLFNNYQNLLYLGYTKKNKDKNPIEILLKVDLPYNIDSSTNNEVILTSEANINKNLKIFRRIAYSSMKKNNRRTYFATPIDLENEILALKLYKKSLKELLNNYETTLQQDLDNYKTNENQNIINILRVLIEEKKIIMRHYNANIIFLKILRNEYANGANIPNQIVQQEPIHDVGVIHNDQIPPPANLVENFLQLDDINVQSILIPEKQSIFILNKINLKKYFDLIKKRFNLNYELNPGNDYSYQDHIVIGEEDDDISDFEDLLVIDNSGNYIENVAVAQPNPLPQPVQVGHPSTISSNVPYSVQGSFPVESHIPPQNIPSPQRYDYTTQNLQYYGSKIPDNPRPNPPHRIEPGLLEEANNGSNININSGNEYNSTDQTYQNVPQGTSIPAQTDKNKYRTAQLRANTIEAEEYNGVTNPDKS